MSNYQSVNNSRINTRLATTSVKGVMKSKSLQTILRPKHLENAREPNTPDHFNNGRVETQGMLPMQTISSIEGGNGTFENSMTVERDLKHITSET
jgi:hypothetical protein